MEIKKKQNEEYKRLYSEALKKEGLKFFDPNTPVQFRPGPGQPSIVGANEYILVGNVPVISGGPTWGICSVVIFFKNGLPILVLHTPYEGGLQSLIDQYKPDSIKVIEGPLGRHVW